MNLRKIIHILIGRLDRKPRCKRCRRPLFETASFARLSYRNLYCQDCYEIVSKSTQTGEPS